MQSVALSKIESVFLPETREQINQVVLDLYSLVNLRGKNGLLEGKIKTYDNKKWPHHLDLSLGAPCKLLLAIPKQKDLEKGKSCEVYAEIPSGFESSSLGIWTSIIPRQVTRIVEIEKEKFKKNFPPSIPEHLKATGFTDL